VIVHNYLRVELDEIWAIVESDLPGLALVVREELAQVDREGRSDEREGTR
jgi:uncharacterized protein with HEPN domain